MDIMIPSGKSVHRPSGTATMINANEIMRMLTNVALFSIGVLVPDERNDNEQSQNVTFSMLSC